MAGPMATASRARRAPDNPNATLAQRTKSGSPYIKGHSQMLAQGRAACPRAGLGFGAHGADPPFAEVVASDATYSLPTSV